MEKVYRFSEETIKQRKKLSILLSVIMLISMIIFSFVIINTKELKNIKTFIIIIFVVMVVIAIEMIVVSSIMYKKLRSMEIALTEDGLKRRGGKFVESLLFEDLTKVQVSKEPSGKIALIKLKTSKKSFNVAGFENMDGLVEDIKEKLEDQSLFIVKNWKLNWNSPVICIGVAIVTMIIIILFMKLGSNIYEIFNKIFIIGFAIFTLIYRPISRNGGKRFRLFETILGIIMLVAEIISIVAEIMM